MTEPARTRLAGLLLLLATFLAYAPALRGGYVWDDDDYVSENALLDAPGGLARLWVPGETPQYYPVVFTSFWVERRVWGTDPTGYHVVNVVLHALAAWLVGRLALALAIPGAWFLAGLFALHPVHVESVAWITERKNVLSGVLYLLAALAYLRFETRREQGERYAWRVYGIALGLSVLALLSKSVTCSLPAVLILLRLWRRRPLDRRGLVPLVPFFAVGLGLALHTAVLERVHVGAEGALFDFSLADRLWIAAHALVFYVGKLAWPWPLSFFYPRWTVTPSDPLSWWPALVLVLVVAGGLVAWRRGTRGPALALAFFAGTLVPALGFFNVYPMRYSFVADHFQYLASLGPLALVAAACARRVPSRVQPGLASIVLVGLGGLTWNQCHDYRDLETLWRATLARNPQAWMAHGNLARVLADRGANEEALEHVDRALELDPDAPGRAQLHLNRAMTLDKLGRFDEALAEYETLQRTSGRAEARVARALERLGRDDDAEHWYRRLAERDAVETSEWIAAGLHYLRRGRPAEAVAPLERAVAQDPGTVDARMFLADALAGSGQLEGAIRAVEDALAQAQASADARTTAAIRERLAALRASR